MRTGDSVLHRPSGERWLVAYVDGDDLAWCGCPSGLARASDCELIRECTDEQHEKLLREMAEMSGSDHRRSYARRALGMED